MKPIPSIWATTMTTIITIPTATVFVTGEFINRPFLI